mgnify:CR=1 FL=1
MTAIPFTLIAGPCVIENRDLVLRVAEEVSTLCQKLGIRYVFKASFDKANRSSGQSFRGPGPEEGLAILQEVGQSFGVPVLTDIHESHQAATAAPARGRPTPAAAAPRLQPGKAASCRPPQTRAAPTRAHLLDARVERRHDGGVKPLRARVDKVDHAGDAEVRRLEQRRQPVLRPGHGFGGPGRFTYLMKMVWSSRRSSWICLRTCYSLWMVSGPRIFRKRKKRRRMTTRSTVWSGDPVQSILIMVY